MAIIRFDLKKQPANGLRNRAGFLIQHSTLGRGQSVRYLQLADMWIKKLDGEGPSECFAFGTTSRQGKTNQVGRVEYVGSIRHKNVNVCTVGAVALYLFYRFEIEKEDPPNTLDNSSWYDTYFMKVDYKRSKRFGKRPISGDDDANGERAAEEQEEEEEEEGNVDWHFYFI